MKLILLIIGICATQNSLRTGATLQIVHCQSATSTEIERLHLENFIAILKVSLNGLEIWKKKTSPSIQIG